MAAKARSMSGCAGRPGSHSRAAEKFASTCIFEIPAKAGIWFSIDFIMFFQIPACAGISVWNYLLCFSAA
jgi:hypothetical protein